VRNLHGQVGRPIRNCRIVCFRAAVSALTRRCPIPSIRYPGGFFTSQMREKGKHVLEYALYLVVQRVPVLEVRGWRGQGVLTGCGGAVVGYKPDGLHCGTFAIWLL
jgi:hypothetical protein